MPRWEAGARSRLIVAAVDLFTEQGYDSTTIAQISERASVTKSTFFRHFPDKREVLVAGQETLSRLLADGISQAPSSATSMQAVESGIRYAAAEMRPLTREVSARLGAAVAASAELQARDALKSVGLAAAMTTALTERGIPLPRARIAAELGVVAFREGHERWVASTVPTDSFAPFALEVLREIRDEAVQ